MAMNAGHNHVSKIRKKRDKRRKLRFAGFPTGKTVGLPGRAALAAAFAVGVPALTLGGTAQAQTDGSTGGLYSGNGILQEILGVPYLIDPSSTASPPAIVNMDSTFFSFIRNPYIAVVQGYAGSYSVNYGNNYTESHQLAGMLSFGNNAGSLRTTTDDLQALNGYNNGDALLSISFGTTKPLGYGVWPLASHYILGTGVQFADYPAYLRLLIDGQAAATGTGTGNGTGNGGTTATATLVPIVGAGNALPIGIEPVFYNGVLTTNYQLPSNMVLRQEIRLFRSLAQLRWTITNTDATAHRVQMRFTVNVRPPADNGLTIGGTVIQRAGFYYEDPRGGISLDPFTVGVGAPGTTVPNQFAIYGARYQPEDATFPNYNAQNPPFAARFVLRDFGATQPVKLTTRDSFEMRPEEATIAGFDAAPVRPVVGTSLAVSAYWDTTVAPGQTSAPIVTYYGNGAATEQIDSDVVIGADALESLGYNTATAATIGDPASGITDPQQAAATIFFPQVFSVYGSVYNRIPDNPSLAVNLTNARASIVLPTGLALAPVPNSGSTAVDTATKVLGNNGSIPADTDARATWAVRATGAVYGTVSYQVAAQTQELGARSVTRSINIPATPLRSFTASGFQMIGFPFEFDPVRSNNGDPATVLNQNEFSRPTDLPVAIYQWIPDTSATATGETGRYQLVTQLQNGIGYFYRPNINRTIIASGVRPTAGQAGINQISLESISQTQRQQILERGWNIISNPYVYDIPLNFLRFVSASDTGSTTNVDPAISNAASQTFTQASQSGLVRPALFSYNPTTRAYDYFDDVTAPLRPWEGYWIYTTQRTVLVYTVPTRPGTVVLPTPDPVTGNPIEPPTRSRKTAQGNIASGRAFVAKPTTANWTLQIAASGTDGKIDKAAIIGVSPTAAASKSAKLPKPPVPFSDYVYTSIVSADGKSRLAKDVRDGKGSKTWSLDVTSDTDGPVTLTWPNINTLPRRVGLVLKDPTTGRSVSLRGISSYTVNVRKGTPTRVEITNTTEASLPLAITDLQAVSTRATQGSTYNFSFKVSRAAGVTYNGVIKTVDGKRTIAHLATGKAAVINTNRLTWGGRAQDGSMVPPGPYKVEITARSEDGQAATTVSPLMVNQ